MNLKCKDCLYKTRNNRCIARSMQINERFVKIMGCDDYKPRYEDLLKDLKVCESK